jgi:septal ring factor EnvC (AmiA/AmiB activator)
MKLSEISIMAWVAVFFAALSVGVHGTQSSPLQKVITLMTQLQGQVIGEGELAQATYKKYSNWCEKSSREKKFEIDEGKDTITGLQASIEKSVSDSEEAQARVEELSGKLATDGQDVKAITLIRVKEKNEFEAMDKELTATVTTISKARSVLKKELDSAGLKAGASFLQRPTKGMRNFATAVNALVTASMGVSAESQDRLAELLQLNQGMDESQGEDAEEEDSQEEDVEANGEQTPPKVEKPKEEVYKSKSGSILELLEKMEEEAQESQAKLRKKEAHEKHNFELLKGRLEDRIKTQTKELEEQKKELASAKESGASAKGKLDMTKKDMEEDKKFLRKLQQGCMERSSEFEMEMKTRSDELNALGAAKKTVQSIVFVQVSKDSPSQDDSDGSAVAFVQVGMEMSAEAKQQAYALRTAGAAVASKLKQLASDEHSVALAQLASRVSRTLQRMQKKGLSGDPFKKVKDLIQNMIDKLEKQQAEEARQKKFCDAEMAESKAAKIDREGTIETLTTRIEEGAAEAAKLNQQKMMLLGEIKDISSSQGEMDELRQTEHATYQKVSKDLKAGLAAVQSALKVLREFYSQEEDKSSFIQDMSSSMNTDSKTAYTGSGGGTAIIGLLEVCESDFSKGLAEADSEEDAAQDEYEKLTTENKKERAVKDKTVANIGTEVARIEKKVSEFTGDRSETKQELDALLEYLEKLTKQCVAQPESYHDRVERRKREIEGLEQALNMLMSQDSPQSED